MVLAVFHPLWFWPVVWVGCGRARICHFSLENDEWIPVHFFCDLRCVAALHMQLLQNSKKSTGSGPRSVFFLYPRFSFRRIFFTPFWLSIQFNSNSGECKNSFLFFVSTFHIGLTANRITGVEKMLVLVIGARKSRVSISFVTFNTSYHHAPSVFLSRAFVIGKFLLWR